MQDPMPSGWFPDPLGRYDHRYFNGRTWTSDVSSDGVRAVDPLGTSPGATRGRGGNGAATAAVVMGSVGLAIAWIPFVVVVGFVLSVLAIIFGARGLGRSRTSGLGRGAAIAGTTMGAIGIAASIVGAVFTVMVWREVIAFVEPGPHAVGEIECLVDGQRIVVDGTITNRDDETRSYVVFVDVGDETSVVAVDDVGPDETVAWQTSMFTFAPASRCEPDVVVHGPFPYGLEIDPVNGATSP